MNLCCINTVEKATKDYQERIAEFEKAMQEFIDRRGEKLLAPEVKYFKYKLKQLLEIK